MGRWSPLIVWNALADVFEIRLSTSQWFAVLPRGQVLLLRSWLKWYRRSLLLRDYLLLLWTILAVEFSLAWSNLTGIYSISTTGQLIPLIIGIASLIPILSQASALVLKKVGFSSSDVHSITICLRPEVQGDHRHSTHCDQYQGRHFQISSV